MGLRGVWRSGSLDELAGPDSGFHPDLCEVLSSVLEGQNSTAWVSRSLEQPDQNALGKLIPINP